MKKIVVMDWLKFVNTKNKPEFENVYRQGYWNVLHHSEELETFLKEKEISYKVTEEFIYY